MIDDELDEQLRDILEANATEGESRVLTQARDQYKSCMDLDRLEEIGLAPLRELLEKFGGWPVVDGDSWSEDSFDWFVAFEICMCVLGGCMQNSSFYILRIVQNLGCRCIVRFASVLR